jgi:hypothetical protein
MNSFRKQQDGTWAVAMTVRGEPGQTVPVTLRSGASKQVKLGAFLSTIRTPQGEQHVFAVAPREQADQPSTRVGEMSGILALFGKAKRHLKRPAIVLGVPELGPRASIRLNIAGDRAKVPGSLTITDGNKNEAGERGWLGRILLDGTFQPSRECMDALAVPAIAARLAAFSADPVTIAGEHGRLTGKCCFCNRGLEDERSTAVGYGPVCASHYDLPWGETRHSFKAEEVARPERSIPVDHYGQPMPNRLMWG